MPTVFANGTSVRHGDVLLFSNEWFMKRRRTGEWSTQRHAIWALLLVTLTVVNCVAVYTPVMMQENFASEAGRERCRLGCFGFTCGNKDADSGSVGIAGDLNSPQCTAVWAPFALCRYFSLIGIVLLGASTLLQVLQALKPELISFRYHYVLAPCLAASGVCMLVDVLVILVVSLRAYCGYRIGRTYNLHYGWFFLLFSTVALFYLAWAVWRGRGPKS